MKDSREKRKEILMACYRKTQKKEAIKKISSVDAVKASQEALEIFRRQPYYMNK